jgi:hypothetical protein
MAGSQCGQAIPTKLSVEQLEVAPENWTVGQVESLGSEMGIMPTKETRR